MPKIVGDKVSYLRDEVEISPAAIENDLSEIINLYKKSVEIEVKNETSSISTGLFYMEKQLVLLITMLNIKKYQTILMLKLA